MRSQRKCLSAQILLSVLILACLASPVARGESEESLQVLMDKYKETKENLNESESEKRKILGSIYSINQRMKRITRRKGQLTDQLFLAQGNVKSTARVISAMEDEIAKQRAQLKTRLRALYKLSGSGYLAILFSQNSAHEIDHTLKYLKIVTDSDYQLMKSYQKNIARHKQQRSHLKNQVQKLMAIEKSIKNQEALLEKEHLAKSTIASDLESKKMESLKKIQSIRSKTLTLSKDAPVDEGLLSLLKSGFFESKGKLKAPVVGRVVQDFGLMTDETTKAQMAHKGWHIASGVGTTVSSVFEGEVVFSGWINGYGNTVIIDHGDHYYSVYGHIIPAKLALGTKVKTGEALGLVTNTSRKFGEGIYFEIRHFTEPENPGVWVEQKSLQISANQGENIKSVSSRN